MVIRPISDLRNTNEISEQCHKIDEPIFITKNGYGDMVIMSMESYEKRIKNINAQKDDAVKQHAAAQANSMGATAMVSNPITPPPLQEEKPLANIPSANEGFEGIRHIREKYGKK